MRLLVLGANGLLGSNVVASALARDWSVAGTYRSDAPAFDIALERLDIRRSELVGDLIEQYEPASVVNCAAMTDVDACETDADRAHDVNGHAPGEIGAICSDQRVRFCHVSTDYVFDGEANRPYTETMEPRPVQVYGESKLAGERAVRAAHEQPLVVRLSFVYGLHGSTGALSGFPAWVGDRLRQGEETPLFRDQHVSPTRAGQAASVILALLEAGSSDTYHVASRSCVTPFEFGTALCRRMDADESLLLPGTMATVERPAPRPRYTCLDVGRVENELERPQPTMAADLDAIDSALKRD